MTTAHTVILLFGRFQPPTKGHEFLIDFALKMAERQQADAVAFLSPTRDQKKNPLSHDEKVRIIRARFPNLVIGPSSAKTPYDALTWAKNEGYTNILLVAGGDRSDPMSGFERIARSWKAAEDPDNTVEVSPLFAPRKNIQTVSGTVARGLAQQGNFDEFKKIFMSGVSDKMIQKTLNMIQDRLGSLNEQDMPVEFLNLDLQLTEAGDGFILREVEVSQNTPPPDEEVVSADDFVNKITTQRGSIDAREADRVPADTPKNQSILVIHPTPRIKRELITKFRDKQKEHLEDAK